MADRRRMRKAAIAGVAMSPIAKHFKRPYKDEIRAVVEAALSDAGLALTDVDGMVFTPPGIAGLSHAMHAHHMGHLFGLPLKTETMVENGGATAAQALRFGLYEVMSKRCDVCVVCAIDIRLDPTADSGMDMSQFLTVTVTSLFSVYGPIDALYGLGAPIPYYAMSAQRYLHETGVTREQLSWVPVTLRLSSARIPEAMYKETIGPEDVTASPVISPPLHLLDCSAFASGTAATVIVSPRVAKELKKRPVWVVGMGEWHDPSSFFSNTKPISTFESIRRASKEAFRQARVAPSDLHVAEVYGVFSATELIILEDLGLFERGTAWKAFADGSIGPDGTGVWVDPSGSRLSLGHPAAATPLMEVWGATRALRGELQTSRSKLDLALVHAEHGMLNGSSVYILEGA
ncbi:MAG: thiolase family protein [Nitrospirae bacterium]|nr:thiolase family protein [Nitrospirota bacterium]